MARILPKRRPGRTQLEAAGWLHDTLEDTATTPDELEANFGAEVRRLVEAVTKEKGGPFHPPTDVDGMRLKAADALYNVTMSLEGLRLGEPIFDRFKQGPAKVEHWRAIADAADRLIGDEPLAGDLADAVAEAEAFARVAGFVSK